jgi:hypothetical protein
MSDAKYVMQYYIKMLSPGLFAVNGGRYLSTFRGQLIGLNFKNQELKILDP